MKRYLIIDEKDFKILSKFASTSRTFNNALSMLNELALLLQNKDKTGNLDRTNIAIDELEILKDVVEHLNNDAKALKFMEYNFATSSIVKENYVARLNEEAKVIQETTAKIDCGEK